MVRGMNDAHLKFCGSEEWKTALRDFVIPYALGEVPLGDDVLEVGPGPGMTTELLRVTLPRLTVIELDEKLAGALESRLAGTNVEVVRGDATAMPFEDARFSGAVSFTMLHHVPTAELQDDLRRSGASAPAGRRVRRLRQPGQRGAGAFHDDDIYNPVDPATVEARFLAAGFAGVDVARTSTDGRPRARR